MDVAPNQYAMHYAVSTPLLKTFHHSALSFELSFPAIRYLSCTLSKVKKRKQALIITSLTVI